MGEWKKAFDDEESSGFYRDDALTRIAGTLDNVTDLRRKIENAEDVAVAKSAYQLAVDAGFEGTEDEWENYLLRGGHKVSTELKDEPSEVHRVWHHARGWLPRTWTTLPEGCFDEADAFPYGWTDPEESLTVSSADTQADGTKVLFCTYDRVHPVSVADKLVTNGI
ncbi:hypothetical protein [Sinorhizobium sp. BJ1]|uniref:hypothetical protein n=1 Tax=Sinorhizobium sp. BJ1 TaxID=2035455 RepID=UPI000BEAD191|nr:hypothetical protein [Sinorhizobium sp. BJ1]PDT81801.1 hypothetical protein CO676_19720 [Sinorhizobium sp. BJ1]